MGNRFWELTIRYPRTVTFLIIITIVALLLKYIKHCIEKTALDQLERLSELTSDGIADLNVLDKIFSLRNIFGKRKK